MKRRSRYFSYIGILALVLGILGANPAFAQNSATFSLQDSSEDDIGELGERLCPVIGPIGEIEGETFSCGLLYVPEDYSKPKGRQIQITYAVLKSKSLSPLPDPVVYLQGGPGGSSIEGLYRYAEIFEELRETRDIIVYDQRGTKYSTRLNCDPYLLMLNYLIATDEETEDLFQDLLDSTSDTAMSGIVAQTYMGACAEGLTEAGYDLTQYNSAISVKDLFALTNALGYDEINLYGISYGTRLALAAMRDHPDQIRSVVLDSTYPPEVDGFELFSTQLDGVLVKLVELCEENKECNDAYPNFGEQLGAVISAFADDPDQLAGLESILSYVNYNPAVAEYIPLMIDEMTRGSTDTLNAIIEGDLPAEEAPEDVPGLQDDLILESEQLQESAEQLFVQAALEAQGERPGSIWMSDVAAAMEPLSEEENALAAIALMVVLLISPVPTADYLEGFVENYLPRGVRADLLEGLDDLSELELQYVYDLIGNLSDDMSASSSGGFTDGMYYSVECNEEAHFNDPEEAEEVADELAYPEFGPSSVALGEQIAAICSVWPSGESDPIENEPVVSDIPTLILAGDYDIQTPQSWGALVMEHLENGVLVDVPASGHGVIVFSECASNIATSFVSVPGTRLVTSCTADLEPDFVTPEEAAADAEADEEDDGPDGTDENRPTAPRGD